MVHPSKQQAPVDRSQLHKPVTGKEHQRKRSMKKGGNGLGNWGRIDDDYTFAPAALDRHDPNYDPDEEESVWEASSWSEA